MPRSLFWWFLAIDTILSLLLSVGHGAWAAPPKTTTGSTPISMTRPRSRWVVSYLTSTERADSGSLPEEIFPNEKTVRERWQWRIFDPSTGRDSLYVDLPTFPTRLRWDPGFTSVEFVADDRIMRAPWRFGATVREQAELPMDSSLCDFWSNGSGGWHALFQSNLEVTEGDFTRPMFVASRWDADSASWRVAEIDTSVGPNGSCFSSEKLEAGAPRPRNVEIQALLDSMRIGNYQDSTISDSGGGADFDAWVWIPFSPDRSVGIEVKAATGDTYHAKEPVVWVNRRLSRRETVYAEGQSRDDALGQIGFATRAGFLLVTAEYSGAYPTVVDLNSGNVLLRVDRPSARAVWVPPPQGWAP